MLLWQWTHVSYFHILPHYMYAALLLLQHLQQGFLLLLKYQPYSTYSYTCMEAQSKPLPENARHAGRQAGRQTGRQAGRQTKAEQKFFFSIESESKQTKTATGSFLSFCLSLLSPPYLCHTKNNLALTD